MKERYTHNLAGSSKLASNSLEKEMADLNLPLCEEDDQHKARRDVSGPPKPFAAFGSYRQRHSQLLAHNVNMRTIEAPAKLESVACIWRGGLSQKFSQPHSEGIHSLPNDCDQGSILQIFKPNGKPYHRGKSFSTDLDRELAWERKKEQYLLEEEDEDSNSGEEYDADDFLDDDSSEKEPANKSSCGSDDEDGTLEEDGKDNEKHIGEDVEGNLDAAHLDGAHADESHAHDLHEDGLAKASKRMPFSNKKSFTRRPAKPIRRTRTKSLTDDDMEELRGSIDLGFGFSYSEHSNLKSTLPALELYYAINKNYVDAQSRSMPGSPLHGSALARTNSSGSASSPSNEAWRISSPGDHPSQVKSRLRHWAQAVACSVKQGN